MLWALLVCLTGCSDQGKEVASLRSSDSNFYYLINNREATRRLASIMYNRTDTAHPAERFKIVHISDTHLSSWSGDNHYTRPNNLIESVGFANQRELKVNALLETGDHISKEPRSRALICLSSFFYYLYQDNQVPTFTCYGNHDSNIDDKTDYLSAEELSSAFGARQNYPIRRASSGKSYYYADVPDPQGGLIRFISLDMLDQPGNEYNTLHYAIYSQEQINWLGNVALKEEMTLQHSVIVLTHFPFQPSLWGGMGKATTEVVSYLNNGDFVHTWRVVPDIIEAYRTRSLLNKSYPNKLIPGREGIKAEFDFTSSAGEFVCYLGGHAHCFALFDIPHTGAATLLPQKMVLCTNQAPSETGWFYNKVNRKENSIISNSFNIYAIDTREKKVYITFFGAYLPYDEPAFPEVLEFSYLRGPGEESGQRPIRW
ncbi:MAG: metallophosphoesterase [Tannerellaceae bacterium]|nr:metallophosphoesterase [Tannerellaceae bacterium]